MAKQLTAAAVARLKPGSERREVPDGGSFGLRLVIQPSGSKSWAMRFRRPNGKQAKLTLGPVDLSGREMAREPVIGSPLTLASARRLAAETNHQRALGRDVIGGARSARLERKNLAAKTFGQAAIDFVEQHAKPNTRTWRETARLLGLRVDKSGELELIPKGLAGRWRDRPVAEITGDDVHAIVDEAREKGVPGLERRSKKPSESRALAMYATLSSSFGWLVERRRMNQNPCAGVARPASQRPRARVLSPAEIGAFWRAAGAERREFAAVLKLLLLTGQRLGEVRGMRRSELSANGKTWLIPAARTKNHREHIVPLPKLARDILAGASTKGDTVFTTNGSVPVAIGSKIKSRLDAAMKKTPPWRLHDLRRTCATGMAEIGVPPHIVEAVLNHVSGHRAGVAGTYNRAAYAAEKKAALERWAAHVGRLVAGRAAKVVVLR